MLEKRYGWNSFFFDTHFRFHAFSFVIFRGKYDFLICIFMVDESLKTYSDIGTAFISRRAAIWSHILVNIIKFIEKLFKLKFEM